MAGRGGDSLSHHIGFDFDSPARYRPTRCGKLFFSVPDLGHFAFYRRPIVFGSAYDNGSLVPRVKLGLVLALARLEHGKAGQIGFSKFAEWIRLVFDRHLLPVGHVRTTCPMAQTNQDVGMGPLLNLFFSGFDHVGRCDQGFTPPFL